MSAPLFVIPAADLEHGPKRVEFEIPQAWLAEALTDSDADPLAKGQLEVELTKNGEQVLVRGAARVEVQMPCARTLEPVHLELRPEIFLMLSRGAPERPRADRPPRKRRGRGPKPPIPGAGKKRQDAWEADAELSEANAAEDTFDGENIVLDGFVREFILLDLPMFPVRSDLPPGENAAIPPAPRSEDPGTQPVDPRLAPLAEIARRLRRGKD